MARDEAASWTQLDGQPHAWWRYFSNDGVGICGRRVVALPRTAQLGADVICRLSNVKALNPANCKCRSTLQPCRVNSNFTCMPSQFKTMDFLRDIRHYYEASK